jgi:hypothetical protein
VREEGDAEFAHAIVEGVAARIGRVDAHRVGQPLEQPRPSRRAALELGDRVGAVGMDRDGGSEEPGMARGDGEDVVVRDVERRPRVVGAPVGQVVAVEREQRVARRPRARARRARPAGRGTARRRGPGRRSRRR